MCQEDGRILPARTMERELSISRRSDGVWVISDPRERTYLVEEQALEIFERQAELFLQRAPNSSNTRIVVKALDRLYDQQTGHAATRGNQINCLGTDTPGIPTHQSHFYGGSRRVKVLIQPLCHWGLQSEMELDLFAIKNAPFGRVRIRFSMLVNRAKFYRAVLNPIFIARTAIL